MGTERVPLPPDKDAWHPSVLPGQIVLVTTVDLQGAPNVAPKSWITMAAFGGPILAFGCHEEHTTYRNVTATGDFAVNIPGEPLAEQVWELIRSPSSSGSGGRAPSGRRAPLPERSPATPASPWGC